jgi:hypothetical protein
LSLATDGFCLSQDLIKPIVQNSSQVPSWSIILQTTA